jgi:predicted nucleotidyltransferase
MMWRYCRTGHCLKDSFMAVTSLENISSWLRERMATRNSLIGEAFVFGSLACRCKAPSDCDLAVVSAYPHSTPEWQELRVAIAAWIEGFGKEFGIPLSVLLLTQRERSEFDKVLSCGRSAARHQLF